MKIKEILHGVEISNFTNFDVKQTLECGQCFRFYQIDGGYSIVAFGKYLEIFQIKDKVIFKNTNLAEFEAIWKKYFDLDEDYSLISKDLCEISSFLKEAYEFSPGIRILRQEPWETLCSFIISQNNNIPRIKGIIARLCENFGEKIEGRYSFPTIEAVCRLTEDEIKIKTRCGFRAKYIIACAKSLNEGTIDFSKISTAPIDEARKNLQGLFGVGAKVAECLLLFGFHRLEAFPMDVWMKRIMTQYFEGKSPDFFGKYAGIAQQYLFHFVRNKKEV